MAFAELDSDGPVRPSGGPLSEISGSVRQGSGPVRESGGSISAGNAGPLSGQSVRGSSVGPLRSGSVRDHSRGAVTDRTAAGSGAGTAAAIQMMQPGAEAPFAAPVGSLGPLAELLRRIDPLPPEDERVSAGEAHSDEAREDEESVSSAAESEEEGEGDTDESSHEENPVMGEERSAPADEP
jgi:hypothetical protein